MVVLIIGLVKIKNAPNFCAMIKKLLFVPFLLFSIALRAQELPAQLEHENTPSISTKTFGCLLPLSGKYKVIGQKALEGILAASESMPPGTQYHAVVKDIGDSSEKLKSAVRELSNIKDLSFIVGPLPSKFIPDASALLSAKKIPTVVFPISEADSSGGSSIIKFYYPVEEQARVLASYAVKELGVKSYAVLYPETALGMRMKDAFVQSLRVNGGNTVYQGSYDSKDRDIEDEVLWISSTDPDGVFIADSSSGSAEIVVQLQKRGGLSDVLFLGPSAWNGSLFLDLAGDQMDGFVYRTIFTDNFYYGGEEWDSFSKRFEEKFQKTPSYLEYQTYLATRLILKVDLTNALGKGLINKLTALRNDPSYIVKRENNGSIRVSPRYLILSIENGELSEIGTVR